MLQGSIMELKQPKPIKFNSEVIDVSFHPSRDLLAVGKIDGEVNLYSYSVTEENHLLMTFDYHKKSCRAVSFNQDGSHLVTASADKSIRVIDMEAGALIKAIKRAHKNAIYTLLVVDRNIVATGDDDGTLKVWDLRHQQAVMDIKENDDCLTDMIVDSTKRLLLATCGEGTLTAFDIRRHKIKLQSELMDSGLQSVAAVKDSEKVVCGSEDGILNFFNWGEWGNISDRFPGHPMSIECIIPISDNIVCTGASDGIRAVNLFPNRFIGIIGDHSGLPIENMSLSHCNHWLASCSHDQHVRFWDVSEVAKEKVDGHKRAKSTNVSKVRTSERNDFFSDLVGDMTEVPETSEEKVLLAESDSDSSDSEDSDKEKLNEVANSNLPFTGKSKEEKMNEVDCSDTCDSSYSSADDLKEKNKNKPGSSDSSSSSEEEEDDLQKRGVEERRKGEKESKNLN